MIPILNHLHTMTHLLPGVVSKVYTVVIVI
ncbi:hypothetical protein FBY13_1029 [Pantoea sp. SJZ147]|nr:hypothetical protein FBY13_1029 [Pantoea sp. SJZ147]